MTEKKLELLNKLKALANDTRGNDNERQTAEKQLELLMKKYKITEEDLGKVERKERKIWHYWDWEYRLVNQVCYKLFPKLDRWSYKRDKHHTYIELTDAEWLEFQYVYGAYKANFEKEVDLFFIAFIQKNRIFPDLDEPPKGPTLDEKYSEGDLLRAGMMAQGIEFCRIRKALGDNNGENK